MGAGTDKQQATPTIISDKLQSVSKFLPATKNDHYKRFTCSQTTILLLLQFVQPEEKWEKRYE